MSLDGEGACGQVGLYCLPGQKKRSITLRSLEVRPLEALHAAAPAEVQKQVENLSKLDGLAKWEDAVAGSAPANVPADVWWRACAVRTLCEGLKPAGPAASGSAPACGLRRRGGRRGLSAVCRGGVDVLREGTGPRWTVDVAVKPLGMALVRNRHPTPFSALERSMLNWPLWHHRRLPVYPDELLRHELVSLLGEGPLGRSPRPMPPAGVFQSHRRAREGEQPPWSPHAEYLVHWADAVAAQYRPNPRMPETGRQAPRPSAGIRSSKTPPAKASAPRASCTPPWTIGPIARRRRSSLRRPIATAWGCSPTAAIRGFPRLFR